MFTVGLRPERTAKLLCSVSFFGTLCAATLLLASCGGSQPPIAAPGAMRQTSAPVTHAARVDRNGSWMLPEAKDSDLLYVTEDYTVAIFTYPQGKLVGALKGFNDPSGECVDTKGNVFITDYRPVSIAEYPHGSSKRIATYKLKYVGPYGCAIDPKTGNLAATGSSEDVEIIRTGHRAPLDIKIPNMLFDIYCTYDNGGNLYVDGLADGQGTPIVSKLPFGGREFATMTFDAPVDTESNVHWDGKYLVLISYGSTSNKKVAPRALRFAVSGTKGTKVGRVSLGKPAYQVVEYALAKDSLVLSNWQNGQHSYEKSVLTYSYPGGGAPTLQVTEGGYSPRGVVVSYAHHLAPRR